MGIYLDDLCDELDSSVFSGDSLHNKKALEEFQNYLKRWTREADRIEEMLSGE